MILTNACIQKFNKHQVNIDTVLPVTLRIFVLPGQKKKKVSHEAKPDSAVACPRKTHNGGVWSLNESVF